MKTILYLSFSLVILAVSCFKNPTVTYIVASRNADCVGVGPQKCLLIKKGGATEWDYFYGNIEGFQYEPGYEYVLEVKEERKEDVPADASSIRFILVREVSKVQKESENLPALEAQEAAVYQCTGRVVSVETEHVGRGAASGKFEVKVVRLEVTSSASDEIKEGETIYCELIPVPSVEPEVGAEYMFRAQSMHPAHAKGVYLLETDVMDLVN